jgi:hypothetical protein
MVTAERSMFGTRLPRPTGVGRHLVVVAVIFALALGIAIYFAERAPADGAVPPADSADPARTSP